MLTRPRRAVADCRFSPSSRRAASCSPPPQSFKAKFNAQTAAVQGSGWGWLVYHPEKDTVAIHTTQNQDPVSMSGLVPLLGVDVWE